MRRPGRDRAFDGVGLQAVLCAGATLASLWLCAAFPVTALGYAVDDDALFVRLGHEITAGRWLGPYDLRTLVKGAGYPLFLAAVSALAVPLRLAEQGVALVVAAFLGRIVADASGRRWAGTGLFVLLAFSPAPWDPRLTRVIREGLYDSLSPALVGLAIVAAFPPPPRRLGGSCLVGASFGLVGAAFWITREEGVWLIPALGVVLLVAAIDTAREGDRRGAVVGVTLFMAVLTMTICLQSLRMENRRHYGVALLNEVQSRPFERAYGALSRIRSDRWRRFVVLPYEARQRVYAASPAARELEPVLDGPIGRQIRSNGCHQLGIAPGDCPEILSGWFFWAVREAVWRAGYRTLPSSRAFYDRLADEIDLACAERRLSCLPRRATMAPPFRWEYLREALVSGFEVASIMLRIHQLPIGPTPSLGTPSQLAPFDRLVGPISPPAEPWERVDGWIVAGGGSAPRVGVRHPVDGDYPWDASVSPRDVGGGAAGRLEGVSRFIVDARCAAEPCRLVVVSSPAGRVSIGWQDLSAGRSYGGDGLRVVVERLSQHADARADRRGATAAFRLSIASALAAAYSFSIPLLTLVGSISVGTGTWRWWFVPSRRDAGLPPVLLALGLASVAAVMTRIGLLAWLDATSLPAANFLYASPAVPFVLVLASFGVRALVGGVGRAVAVLRAWRPA